VRQQAVLKELDEFLIDSGQSALPKYRHKTDVIAELKGLLIFKMQPLYFFKVYAAAF